jgi:hypothetical protein
MSANAVLERHKRRLLAIPGVRAVAIGYKAVGGESTDVECIVVFVASKGPPGDPADVVAPEIEGVPTDVVQREFAFRPTVVNPFARYDPIFGGLSMTAIEDPHAHGTIGCFIAADGHVVGVPAGPYLLTNMHVVQIAAAAGANRRVIQPGNTALVPVPANYVCGEFVKGQRDAQHDCAITTIVGRGWRNEVPNHPGQAGNRALAGLGAAALGMKVYKYGATTQHTVGSVTNVNFNFGNVANAIYITGEGGPWCDGGDSGAVVIRYADDIVVGLLFQADTQVPVPGGFLGGLAYDITSQILPFSTVAALA